MTRRLELVHEPGTWEVQMVEGGAVTVAAHSYSHEGDSYVFTLLMEGDPCFEVEVARIPTSLVNGVRGG